MKSKKFFIVWVSSLVIILLILIIINIPKKEVSDAKTWIKTKGTEKEIDIEKATQGSGFIDSIGQQLRTETIETVFDYEGYYKGNFFRREYTDENKNMKMRISTDMIPNDGIIEAYIIEKIEDNKPIAYIFLDEDWKNNLAITNIFWGRNFEYEKPFVFTKISEGVYMTKIDDDASRFSENYKLHYGGIIIGDLTREDDKDKTLIKFI